MNILKTRRIDLEPLFGKPSQPRSPSQGSGRAGGGQQDPALDFRVLFENAYDAILVTDSTGRVLTSNRRAHVFFRDAPEEMTDQGLVDLIPGLTPDLISSIVSTVSTRRFTLLQAWCHRADNTMFPAEVVVTGAVHNDSTALFLQIRDATVRRESEERLLSITRALNTAAVGIGTADLAGNITYANPYLAEKFAAANVDEMTGKSLSSLLGKNDVCEKMLGAVRNNKVWSDEISLVIRDQVVWLQLDVAPHQDSEGVLSGMVFCMRDTGDRKRAEAAEYEVSRNRLMMESMSAAYHLLGQPATVMLSCLEIIRSRSTPDPAADEPLFKMVYEAADEMRTILHQMHSKSVS